MVHTQYKCIVQHIFLFIFGSNTFSTKYISVIRLSLMILTMWSNRFEHRDHSISVSFSAIHIRYLFIFFRFSLSTVFFLSSFCANSIDAIVIQIIGALCSAICKLKKSFYETFDVCNVDKMISLFEFHLMNTLFLSIDLVRFFFRWFRQSIFLFGSLLWLWLARWSIVVIGSMLFALRSS